MAPSSTSSSAAEPRKDKQLDAIQAELDQAFVLIGSALSPIAPVTGAVFVSKGPQGSDIICNMARRDERILRALLSISKYAVYGELAMFLATVGIAVAVDVGAQAPESMIARRLIGNEILTQVYANRDNASNGSNPPPANVGTPEYPNWRGPGPVEVPTGWST